VDDEFDLSFNSFGRVFGHGFIHALRAEFTGGITAVRLKVEQNQLIADVE
jgi:hypothetical protein